MNVDEVRAIKDPSDRARIAGHEIDHLAHIEAELSRIRVEAVAELRARGLSHADIAGRLGISRSRAAALAAKPTNAFCANCDTFRGINYAPVPAALGVDVCPACGGMDLTFHAVDPDEDDTDPIPPTLRAGAEFVKNAIRVRNTKLEDIYGPDSDDWVRIPES